MTIFLSPSDVYSQKARHSLKAVRISLPPPLFSLKGWLEHNETKETRWTS